MKHLISALSGSDSERAPSDYVEKLFDDYAAPRPYPSGQGPKLQRSGKAGGIFLEPYHDPAGEKMDRSRPGLRHGIVWCRASALTRGNSSASICRPRCSRKHGSGTCTIVSNNWTC